MFGQIEHDAVERGEVLRTSVLFPILMLLIFCIGLVSGCGGTLIRSTSAAPGVSFRGMVLGGQQPVTGAMVYLYAAGSTGYGSASTSLLNTSISGVSTDGNGIGYVTTDGS